MRHSFRGRLFRSFLVVSLVPLLVCSTMLLQIFRLRMTSAARQEMAGQLSAVSHTLDTAFYAFDQTAAKLRNSALVAGALAGTKGEDTLVYQEFFEAVGQAKGQARFDLYDLEGRWRYSTDLRGTDLPTDWGVLYAAAGAEEGLVYRVSEDISNTDAPQLQGAALLRDEQGAPAGYLVVSLYYSHLHQLLEGVYDSQNDLVLLSRYWRPVYALQPSLADSLADRLRVQLLDGQGPRETSEGFFHSIAWNEASGLYMVLQRPQIFTQETMRLLYTVSLACAVVCVAISILMSLKLSRQLFRPIDRLHRGIGEVVQNHLDVRVPPEGDDELAELAQRFNGMVTALKCNQEQLVDNQRELNQAQIRMLQAQLNPHFLCNTLDTMKWISKINRVPQVALMSTNLADILRFCISPEEFVPLRREAEILDRYIEIQRIRMSGAFTYAMDLPPELEDCLIPKMILQPLVENAILHGLAGRENGYICVYASQSGSLLKVAVTDDGCGMPQEMVDWVNSHFPEKREGHVGLYNVIQILKLHYGQEYGMQAQVVLGEGTTITITLPLEREAGVDCPEPGSGSDWSR